MTVGVGLGDDVVGVGLGDDVVGVGLGDDVVGVGLGDDVVGFGDLLGEGVDVGTGVGADGKGTTGSPSSAPDVYAVQIRVGYSAPVKTSMPPTPFSGAWGSLLRSR